MADEKTLIETEIQVWINKLGLAHQFTDTNVKYLADKIRALTASTPAIPAELAEAVSAAKTSVGTNNTFHYDWDTTCHISKGHLNTLITAATSSQSLRDENTAERVRGLAEALETIRDICDEEIKCRFKCFDKTEEECAGKSVVYGLLVVPRNLAKSAIDTYRGKEASDGNIPE